MSEKKITIGTHEIVFKKNDDGYEARYEPNYVVMRFLQLIEEKAKELFPECKNFHFRIFPEGRKLLIIIEIR